MRLLLFSIQDAEPAGTRHFPGELDPKGLNNIPSSRGMGVPQWVAPLISPHGKSIRPMRVPQVPSLRMYWLQIQARFVVTEL